MVGQTATACHDLVSGGMLNSLVVVHSLVNTLIMVVKSKVNVDSGTSLIELSDSERNPDVFLLEAELHAFADNSLSDILDELGYISPRDGCLEGLGSDIVVTSEITDVSDQVSQNVTLDTVLGTSWHTTELSGDSVGFLAHLVDFIGISFEKKGASSELIWIVTLDVNNIVGLNLINERLKGARLSRLETLTKLELGVVNKTD
mmetsp:Transcript_18686/g.13386  ORF Transcript_18686/g.13386 Transcript_18686/m.13386 type:complete len:203 (-) Transcript_18686:1202-1810(-)